MSEYHDREVLNAGKLGTYRVHSLFTRISSEGDMEPEFGEPNIGAVALHAHEYTHYLHNLSTMPGLDALQACFWLFRPFINNTDAQGKFNPPLDQEGKDEIDIAFKVMNAARGWTEGLPKNVESSWPKISEWIYGSPAEEHLKLSSAVHGDIGNILVCAVPVTARINKSQVIEFTLRPGLDFITEGVAYEVEREQRRLSGIPEWVLDDQTPSFPYLAYRPFIEHFSGRATTSEERILIGNLALMTSYPTYTIFKICEALKADHGRGDGVVNFEKVRREILSDFEHRSKQIEHSYVMQIREITAGSEFLRQGAEIYARLIDKSLSLRAQDPILEAAFIRQKLSPEQFRNITLHMVERLVCQEKVGEPATLEWIGVKDSVADLPDEAIQKVAVLQASIHYLQQHFTADGRLGCTADLREAPCPFYGACETERQYGNPPNCRNKPWLVSIEGGAPNVCWYEAARLALRQEKNLSA